MFKNKFSLRTLGAAAVLSIGSLAMPTAASGQTLSDILRGVQEDSRAMSAENQQRVAAFQQARDQQAAIMAEAQGELNVAEARGRTLSAQFDTNAARIGELQDELAEEAGDFGELLGQFRQAAGETMPVIANSLANFDSEGDREADRVGKLSAIAQASSLPTRADLDTLPKAILQEMIAQSEVRNFTANVSNGGDAGENAELELMRIGVFTAATTDGTRFVEVDSSGDEIKLVAFASQPGGDYRGNMQRLIGAAEGDVVRAPVDPTKGDLFAIFGNTVSLGERLAQGGPVGFLIFWIILPIGVLLGLFKIVTLFLMGNSMRSTAKRKAAGTGNPLARIFEAYENHKNDDIETLELKLDEQILRESPKIERFNDIVKVLAAVAPLLGLLGTVVGMIVVFTAITNYGTGDPKIMAGGISTALVTTVLGLVAAIPLLLLNAVGSSMARGNQQILDEQAAGLVAERAERAQTGAAA